MFSFLKALPKLAVSDMLLQDASLLVEKKPLRKFQKVLIYLNPNSDTLGARGETRVLRPLPD